MRYSYLWLLWMLWVDIMGCAFIYFVLDGGRAFYSILAGANVFWLPVVLASWLDERKEKQDA
jgi:hypothetical protein